MKTKILLLFFVITVQVFSQSKMMPHQGTVYVFLSETCPICQNYTLPLKEMYNLYKDKGIRFIGVFPNYYVSQKEVNEFKQTYAIPFDVVMDKKGTLTKKLKARITPEVFVENKSGLIVYSGRIDDTFYAIGKRRTLATTHELQDALSQLVSGQAIKVAKTKAIGCVISSSK